MDPHSHHQDIRALSLALIPKTWRSPIAKATVDPQYEWLLEQADRRVPGTRKAFLDALAKAKDAISQKALEDALSSGSVDRVVRALDLNNQLQQQLGGQFRAVLEDTLIGAGRAAAAVAFPKTIQTNISFNMRNPRVQQFLADYDLRNAQSGIRQITQDTADGIRRIVQNAFAEGGSPAEQARQIRNLIGLTDRQARAVTSYQSSLIEEERPADQVARMTEAYSRKLLNLRANTIARTETIRAANAGQQSVWHQAADEGYLDRGTVRQMWLITPDDRLCPACALIPIMNPTGVPLGGSFNSVDGPVDAPPLHPACRCGLYIITEPL